MAYIFFWFGVEIYKLRIHCLWYATEFLVRPEKPQTRFVLACTTHRLYIFNKTPKIWALCFGVCVCPFEKGIKQLHNWFDNEVGGRGVAPLVVLEKQEIPFSKFRTNKLRTTWSVQTRNVQYIQLGRGTRFLFKSRPLKLNSTETKLHLTIEVKFTYCHNSGK